MRYNKDLGHIFEIPGFTRITALLLALTCWRACEGQLASDAVWPCYGADPQHTRRSRFLGPQNDSAAVLWSQDLGAESTPVVDANGNIYIGSNTFQVNSLDAGGRLRWTYTAVGYGFASTPVLDADGTVYITCSDNVLYAIDGNTGNLKWSQSSDGNLYSSVIIGQDNTLFVPADGMLFALRGDTGVQNWMLSMGESVWSSPAIGYDGTVYISTTAGQTGSVYALDGSTGAIKWSNRLSPKPFMFNSPTIGSSGYLYIGSDKLYSLFVGSGVEMFVYNAGGDVQSTAALSPNEDMVYFVANGNLLALTSYGVFKWSVFFSVSSGWSDAIAVGADGTVYAGSFDSTTASLLAYDGYTGAVRWQYQLPSNWYTYAHSLTIAADGVLVVGTDNGYLHAIGTPRTYPSASPTPTPTHTHSPSPSVAAVSQNRSASIVGGAVGGVVGGVAALVVVVGVIVFVVQRGKIGKRTQEANSSIVHTNSNIILTKQSSPLSPSEVNGVNFGQQQEVYSPGYMNAPTAPAGDDNNPTTKLDVKSGYDNGNESKGDGTSSSYGGYPHTTTTATVQYLFEMPPPPTFVEGDAHTPYGYPNPVDSLL